MKKILVVDDDATVREALINFLGHHGYNVQGVENGEKAIPLAKLLRPQVVLLDVLMPGMGGIETLRRLRQITPKSTVIMISGQTDQEVAKYALTIGAYDYVVKPIDFKYLKWILQVKMASQNT